MEKKCEECEWGILKMLLCFDVWVNALERLFMHMLGLKTKKEISDHFLKQSEEKEE